MSRVARLNVKDQQGNLDCYQLSVLLLLGSGDMALLFHLLSLLVGGR